MATISNTDPKVSNKIMSSQYEDLKRINKELQAEIKQLTKQIDELKSDNEVKDEIIKSLEFQLENVLKLTSSKQNKTQNKHDNDSNNKTLHQNKQSPPKQVKQVIQGNGIKGNGLSIGNNGHNEKIINKNKIENVSELEEKKESQQPLKSSPIASKSRGIIGIIGAGTIGSQLAASLSFKKYKIILIDSTKSTLEKSKKVHRQICDSYLHQNFITKQDIDSAKIVYCNEIDDLKKYHDTMHTVIDTLHDGQKKHVLQRLAKLINDKCMIITSSKQKCITEISSCLYPIAPNKRENVIGINLLWFEQSMTQNKCIEIIPSWNTSLSIIEKCKKLVANDLGKQYVVINDQCGFISNRLMAVYLNEAFTILENKVASAEDIDKVQVLINHQMMGNIGPFAMADKIGLYAVIQILDELYREYGLQKYVANSMLKQYVRSGKYGRNSGVGVYSYNNKRKIDNNKQTQKIQK